MNYNNYNNNYNTNNNNIQNPYNNYNSNNPNVIPMMPSKQVNPYVANANNGPGYNNFNQPQQPAQPQYIPPGYVVNANYQPPQPQQPQQNPWGQQQQFQGQQQQQQQQQKNNGYGGITMNVNGNNNLNNNGGAQNQNNQSGNPELQKQLDQIRQRYPYTMKPISSMQTNVFLELDIPNNKIPIRIQLDKEFPRIKPLVFLRKQLTQQNVDDKTWRVRYESFHRWEPTQGSTLLNLIQAISSAFQQYPPQPDYLQMQITDIKNTVNEQVERQKIRTIDTQKVFPGRSQEEYRDLLTKPSWADAINSSNDIASLRKRVGEIADFNLKMSSDLLEQQAHLDQKKAALQKLNSSYEVETSSLVAARQSSNSLQERFSSMGIIQALSTKIDQLEAESSQLKSENFEEDIRAFRDKRAQYHLLNKKREKLMNYN